MRNENTTNSFDVRDIQIRGLRISSDTRFQTSDGIHVVSSQNMTISDCLIDSEDDALAFYTNWAELPGVGDLCASVTVTNCVLYAKCCGIPILRHASRM